MVKIAVAEKLYWEMEFPEALSLSYEEHGAWARQTCI